MDPYITLSIQQVGTPMPAVNSNLNNAATMPTSDTTSYGQRCAQGSMYIHTREHPPKYEIYKYDSNILLNTSVLVPINKLLCEKYGFDIML